MNATLVKHLPDPDSDPQREELIDEIDHALQLWYQSGRGTDALMADISALVKFYWPFA